MIPGIRYVRQRVRAKGVLNVLSAISRVYWNGRGASTLAHLAWLKERTVRSQPEYRVVAIETMSGCNYRCSFCPIGQIPLPSGRMSMTLFERIIDQLAAFDGEIHLFFMNEPLLDRRLPDMARLAKTRTGARIVIQTNGSVLTKDLAEALLPSAAILVNDYTEDHSVTARVRGFGLTHPNLVIVPRNGGAVLTNRAGNLPDRPPVRLDNFCVRPFRELYIAHDGRVLLCCQDWSFEQVMGDAGQMTLEEIWNGETFRRIRRSLLDRRRTGLCAKCDFPGV